MLRVLANNKRPAILNAIVFAILYMLLFVLILLPFVLIALSRDSGALDDAVEAVYANKSETYKALDQVLTYIPFVALGGLTEIVRRTVSYRGNNKAEQGKLAKECLPADILTASALLAWIVIRCVMAVV